MSTATKKKTGKPARTRTKPSAETQRLKEIKAAARKVSLTQTKLARSQAEVSALRKQLRGYEQDLIAMGEDADQLSLPYAQSKTPTKRAAKKGAKEAGPADGEDGAKS